MSHFKVVLKIPNHFPKLFFAYQNSGCISC